MKNTTKTRKTASQAYAASATEIGERLAAIDRMILDRGDCREKNWAQAGDLAHVAELLRQAQEFLAGR